MGFIKGLLWLMVAVVLIVLAMYLTGNYELADRLAGIFLAIQPWLPVTLNFDQFLVVLTVLCFILVSISLSACAGMLMLMGTRLSVARQKQFGQAAAAKREIDHIKQDQHSRYEQLTALSHTLTKRLDKRVIVQAVIEATSRLMSVPQANSIVSCWILNFETDTIRFEMGHYCNDTLFAQREFQPTEPPFSRAMATQKSLTFASWQDAGANLLKPEKAAQLGAATGLIVVPLVIENSVLGVLLVSCHPDVLKSYEEQKPFYETMWGELALALAIAIQGEVAILDRLTGVHNREYFMKRLIQEIERANRFQLPISLLMVDIDNFKAVNDTLGHPQGDAVLRIVSKLLKREIRAIDLAGRYGGEEFIVLLPETGYGEETNTASGALVVAERVRKSVDDEFHGMLKPLNLTVSIGVCVRRFPEDKEWDFKELVRLADEQLYKAKTSGKNKVCVHLPEKNAQAVS